MNPPANVNQDVQEATSALEKQQNSESMTITTLLQKRATKLYNDARAEEFMSSLMSATEKNPKIKQCSPSSIITAMTACIQLDLVPETSQQFAYLIPYSGMLQFQIGYKGLIELAYRSGEVLSINAELVFPEDDFDFTLGTSRGIMHKPDMSIDRTDFDRATHVYSTGVLKNGGTIFDVMSMSEIKKIRDTVKAKSTDAPWKTWPEQMSKKTVIKRMCKYAPQSKEDKRLQQAIEWDSLAEVGKLQYDKGSLVAGSTVAEEAQQEQKIQLKAFAKPVEETKPTEEAKTTPVPAKDADFTKQIQQTNTYTREELVEKINDAVEFLDIKQTDVMKRLNELGDTPFVQKATTETLQTYYKELDEQAKEKTLAVISTNDPVSDVTKVFEGSKQIQIDSQK